MMEYRRGQRVKHPKLDAWGIGEVLGDSHAGTVRVNFENAGLKQIRLDLVDLVVVEGREATSERLDHGPEIDIEKVKQLCDRFYLEMTPNRRNSDDGRLALNIMGDLTRYGRLTRTTMTQLAAWCHTEGSVYQAGVPIAQELSIAIFGYIIQRE